MVLRAVNVIFTSDNHCKSIDMAKIEIYGIGEGSKKKLLALANEKEISESEYCKHVLLDHLKAKEDQKKGMSVL